MKLSIRPCTPNPIPTHHPHPHPLPPQPHTHPTPTPHPPYPHPTPQPNFYYLRIVQCIFNYVYQNWLRQFRWHFSHFALVANGICYCLRLLYSRPITCHETRIIYTDIRACFTGGHYWVTFLVPFLSFESPKLIRISGAHNFIDGCPNFKSIAETCPHDIVAKL